MRSLLAVLSALALCAPLAACGPAPRPSPPSVTTPSVPSTTAAPATTTPSAITTAFAPTAAWPRLSLVQRWGGLSQPIFLTVADVASGRVFIVEKGGRVRTARGGTVESRPFLDVSDRVSTGGEQGLLSIAFPPGPASAERVYACYTATNGDVVVSRFRVSGGVADAASEQRVLRVPHSAHPNHNGGQIEFGPDGMLYVGIGDGGGEGDPNGYGQDLGVLYGKILRIDVEGIPASGVPATYIVPRGNPFVTKRGVRAETWAWGLRNPWRFSFDAATNDLYIGDVGQNSWEEIDFQPAGARGGANYGWSIMEGFHPFNGGPASALTPPVAEYGHDLGNAVVGGYVYRGSEWPKLAGVYLFADNGSGRVWALRRTTVGTWQMRELLQTSYSVSSFGQDGSHELYVLDLSGGGVYQVTAP